MPCTPLQPAKDVVCVSVPFTEPTANWFELKAPERAVQPAPHAAEVPEALAWKFGVAFRGCA